MNDGLPKAKSGSTPQVRERLEGIITERGLCGLANDTKWDELISTMREREAGRPPYRFKCLDGEPSRLDNEWFHHLPFPFLLVEWFDLRIVTRRYRGGILFPEIRDESDWIVDLLSKIGFDYQRGSTMVRIFGYSPKNYDLFEPELQHAWPWWS